MINHLNASALGGDWGPYVYTNEKYRYRCQTKQAF